MEFKEVRPRAPLYPKHELDLARDFSKQMMKEMGTLVKVIALFGSTSRAKAKGKGDIDVLVVVDDVTMQLSPEMVDAYRIITQKIIAKVSTKIHVTTLKLSNFWEYVRSGDPVAINILRDGLALVDSGFFGPLQALLWRGRIRPSPESIYTYYSRAPRTLWNSRWHINQASLDLYWAVIDAAHAALMKVGEIPPSPAQVAEYLHKDLVKKHLLEEKYVKIMERFYRLMKLVTHREVQRISGKEYESYFKAAEDFVNRMRKIVESK